MATLTNETSAEFSVSTKNVYLKSDVGSKSSEYSNLGEPLTLTSTIAMRESLLISGGCKIVFTGAKLEKDLTDPGDGKWKATLISEGVDNKELVLNYDDTKLPDPITIESVIDYEALVANESTDRMVSSTSEVNYTITYDLYYWEESESDPNKYEWYRYSTGNVAVIENIVFSITQDPAPMKVEEPKDPYEGMTDEEKEEQVAQDTSPDTTRQNRKELMENVDTGTMMKLLLPLLMPILSQALGLAPMIQKILGGIQKLREMREANIKNYKNVVKILNRLLYDKEEIVTGTNEEGDEDFIIPEPIVEISPDESSIRSTAAEGGTPEVQYSIKKEFNIDKAGLLTAGKIFNLLTKYDSLIKKKTDWEAYRQDPDSFTEKPKKFDSGIDGNLLKKCQSDIINNVARVVQLDGRFGSDEFMDLICNKEDLRPGLYPLITRYKEMPTGTAQDIAINKKQDEINLMITQAQMGIEEGKDEESAIQEKLEEMILNSDIYLNMQKEIQNIDTQFEALVKTSPVQVMHGVTAVVEPMGAIVVTPVGPAAVTTNVPQIIGAAQDLKVSMENALAPINNIYASAAKIGIPPQILSPLEALKSTLGSAVSALPI